MILHAAFRLPLILSVELLVLIAALFLMVYISKQQVSKWYTYGAALIVLKIIVLMICTCCLACCMNHCEKGGMSGGCEMERGMPMGGHHKMMMKRIVMDDMGENQECEMKMMGKGDCCKEMGGEGEMECCKKKMECCEEGGKECCKMEGDKDHMNVEVKVEKKEEKK